MPFKDPEKRRAYGREASTRARRRKGMAERPKLLGLDADSMSRYLACFITPASDGCWNWTGCLNHDGYGFVRYKRFAPEFRSSGAHRVLYKVLIGPIPAGLTLDHLCRNRRCVNPLHVEPVTNGENVKRGRSFSSLNREKTHCARGHEYSPENTMYRTNGGGRDCRECKRENWRKYNAQRLARLRDDHVARPDRSREGVPE